MSSKRKGISSPVMKVRHDISARYWGMFFFETPAILPGAPAFIGSSKDFSAPKSHRLFKKSIGSNYQCKLTRDFHKIIRILKFNFERNKNSVSVEEHCSRKIVRACKLSGLFEKRAPGFSPNTTA